MHQHLFTILLATIRKEWLLLSRDLHGLALLFVMPATFILIMSLALQEQFAGHSKTPAIDVLLHDSIHDDSSSELVNHLRTRAAFQWLAVSDTDVAQQTLQRDDAAALVALQQTDNGIQAHIRIAPGTTRQTETLITAAISEAISRQRIATWLREQQRARAFASGEFSFGDTPDVDALLRDAVQVAYGAPDSVQPQRPNAVQQNVPAWLVFAMFFAVIPLSNALIGERQQGTLRRLRTLPVPVHLPVIGKLIPYFLINQLQVLLMLAIGVFAMPWFGGESLTLGDSPAGLMLMACAMSLAALGYGILVAVLARTTEQAALLGGTGNLLLAALGGIMVPRFVMPDTMQQLALVSPMAWGLEGFLDILLRQGTIGDVLPEAAALFGFGTVTIATALFCSKRRND